jgi:DNA-binding response OmpR family regulator
MKKILIIEDDQLVANIYRNKFTVENYEVEIALDGESGLEMVNSFQPDLAILDLMLPKVTGLDLLKKIRAQESTKNLPVIVFSNTYLSNMVQEAWKAGATKCLSKANCTPKQVIEVVRSLANSAVAASASGTHPTTPHATNAASHGANTTRPVSIAAETDDDATFQSDLRHSFLESMPASLAAARAHLQSIAKSHDEEHRVKFLQELYRAIHTLTANAGIAGVVQIAQMADALEALVKELYEKPKSINASTLRTVALAIDFLGKLFEQIPPQETPNAAPAPRFNILVVDDEAISRRAVTYALEKARLPCIAVENPEAALGMLGENIYDLVFLDVDMPGMNGFELCTKLRALARNKTTPVVFVTSLTDFESRANSTMSGGNDLIAKPFLFMELAVKALVYVLRGRLAQAAAVKAATSAPTPALRML